MLCFFVYVIILIIFPRLFFPISLGNFLVLATALSSLKSFFQLRLRFVGELLFLNAALKRRTNRDEFGESDWLPHAQGRFN